MDSLLMMEEMTSYYHPCKDEDDAVKFENVTAAWDGIEAKVRSLLHVCDDRIGETYWHVYKIVCLYTYDFI